MKKQPSEQPQAACEDRNRTCAMPFGYPSPVILAVDDSPEVRGFIAGSLGRNYTVLVASNGIEAIERLEQVHVDLIVTDICMPEMGGLELADFVKRHYPNIALVFVSSCLDEETQRAADCRSPYSLSKPFTLSSLRGMVEAVVEQ